MEKQRLAYNDALKIAHGMVDDIAPYCERIEIAGSLRRKKETIGDIELVCIPKIVQGLDLLGGPGERVNLLDEQLRTYRILKGGEKYKQIELASINVDVFITTPEAWGVIYTIRTGSADFTHWLVTSKQQGGALPSNLRVADGRIWYTNTVPLSTPEEADVFKHIGLDWIPPEQRVEGRWRK